MARFEIETVVKDGSNAKGAIDGVSSSINTLSARYQKLQNEIKKSVHTSRELEGQLRILNNQFKSGAISERQYVAENKSIKSALDSARDATQQYNRQLISLKATMKQNASAQNSFGQATKKLTGYHRDFQGGIRSSNAVAVEFGRIIQDAPYGMQGVANNLQQLTQNFSYYARAAREAAAAQGKTISTFSLLKGAAGSLLNPLNLLTIGISVLTAGWVAYEKWGNKAKKTTDDIKVSFDDYLKTLENVRAATLKGTADAQKDISQLRVLYNVTQDVTLSMSDRIDALKTLQQQYPKTFANLTQEQILAGEAASAYDTLAKSMIAVAKAKGFTNQIAENSIKLIGEEAKLADARIKQAKAQAAYDASVPAITPSSGLSPTSVLNIASDKSLNALRDANKEVRDIKDNIKALNEENLKYESKITEDIRSGALSASDLVGGLKDVKSKSKEIASILEEVASLSENIASIWKDSFSINIDNSLDQLKELQKELDKVYKTPGFDPFDRSGVFSRRPPAETKSESIGVSYLSRAMSEITPKVNNENIEKELNRVMSRSVQRFGNEFFKIVTDLGQYSEGTFKGAISDIIGRLSNSFSGVFTSIIGTQLKDVIKTNLEDIKLLGLDKKVAKALTAGAGIAGSIISGAVKPTSSLGQGIGGALSGAAAGTAIAPGIGTAIGAIVGGIAGLFGASAARKKEQELLEKQLEEQKKQTEIMRKSALSYTSEIVGQMTNQGIVTGVERNEFGDIELRLAGNNLEGSVSRTENAKKRGL